MMTPLNQTLTNAMGAINRTLDRRDDYPSLQRDFEQALSALNTAATEKGYATPFTDGGITRAELAPTTECDEFWSAEKSLIKAKHEREALLTGVAIATGSIAGATLAGLALREAYRRNWADRAVKKLTAATLTRAYGKLAGQAYLLIKNGRVTTILDERTGTTSEGSCRFTGEGFIFTTLDGERAVFSLDAVTGIEQTIDHQGNVKHATLCLIDYTNLDDDTEEI